MLDKLEAFINRIEEYVCVALLAVMSVAVLGQVLFRYVFAVPLSWTEELARYCLIWLTFMAGAMCIRSNSHFVIELLLEKLPVAPRLLLQVLILCSVGAFAGVMFYTGVTILPIIDLQVSPALRISMGYVYLAIPIGSFLMVFHAVCAILRRLRGFKQPSADIEALAKNGH